MQDDLIRKIAQLMTEQSAAYTSLDSLMNQLTTALTVCEPNNIEALSRAGETELMRMRSRLLDITSALTNFSEIRAHQTELLPIAADVREQFETAANELIKSAKEFETKTGRATSLALGGLSFATAGIQMCGVPPTTYRAPVLKYTKGGMR